MTLPALAFADVGAVLDSDEIAAIMAYVGPAVDLAAAAEVSPLTVALGVGVAKAVDVAVADGVQGLLRAGTVRSAAEAVALGRAGFVEVVERAEVVEAGVVVVFGLETEDLAGSEARPGRLGAGLW